MYKERGGRPITRASINSRSQMRTKKNWDDRFSIERMPEYNALNDRHCQAYVNMLKKKVRKPKRITGKIEMGPGRIRRRKIRQPMEGEDRSISRRISKRPPKAGMRINRGMITEEMIQNLEQELDKAWVEHGIPQYHKEIFNKYLKLLSKDSAGAMMAKEISDLEKNKAPIQKVSIAIVARENCLDEIQQFGDHGIEVLENYITKCTHKLHSLRMLSLNAVECIVIWREQMLYAYNQSTPMSKNNPAPSIPYIWDGVNYLVKMKTDTDFLVGHTLSRYFNFSDKNDPFLVIPSWAHTGVGLKGLKKGRGKAKLRSKIKSDKFEVPLDNSLMQRIKASEVILDREINDAASDAASPMSSKKPASPTKDVEMEDENNDPNQKKEEEKFENVPKRQNLFEIRKQKNTDSSKDVKPSETSGSPEKSPQKSQNMATEQVEDIPDEEMFDFELEPLELQAPRAVEYLQDYTSKIDKKFNTTYNTPGYILEECFKGNNAKFFKIMNKTSTREVDGILIYSGDSHFDRINIHHLSTINKKGLEEAIKISMEHIWKYETAKEVRIGLHHYDEEKNGKVSKVVDPEIKLAMKTNKLKWKSILNVQNDRILIMGSVRDKSDTTRNELENMLTVKSALLYSVSGETVRPQSATSNNSLFFIPGLWVSSLIDQIANSETENIPAHHQIILGILEKVQGNNIEQFPNTVSNKDTDPAKAIEPASVNEVTIEESLIKPSQTDYHCNVTKVEGKLLSIDYWTHKVNSQDYMYLRIKTKDMMWVKAPDIDSEIFFMSVGNKSDYGLLIFKKPTNANFSTSVELYDYWKDITSNMSETQTTYKSGLYLPCFSKEIQNEKLDFMHGFQPNENSENVTDTVFSSFVTIRGKVPEKWALKFTPDNQSYVIEGDYIFVLTHPVLEEQAKVPFVCGLVTQSDWIKA